MRSNKLNATQFLLKRNLFIGVMVFLIVFFTLPFWGLAFIAVTTAGGAWIFQKKELK